MNNKKKRTKKNIKKTKKKTKNTKVSNNSTLNESISDSTIQVGDKRNRIIANRVAGQIIDLSKTVIKDIKKLMESLQSKSSKLSPNYSKFMVKSHSSLSDKIYKRLKYDKQSIDIIKKNLGDYIRFTYIISENKYKEEVIRIIKELYIQGGMCSPLKPGKKVVMWDLGDYYQGINTVYKCNKFKNIPIEIQFHTQSSIKTKELKLHPLYEKYRKKCKTDERKKLRFCKTLSKKMLEYEKSITIPKDIDQSDNKINIENVVKFIK